MPARGMYMRSRVFFCLLIALSSTAHSATVISRDNTRHEGVIVEDTADGVKLKMKMGTLEAFVTVPRADILEIQNTPARVNPIDVEAKEILNDAEFAMQTKNLKEAAAAWAKLGALYQGEPGYSAKAKEAFENALTFDPQNALALSHPRAALSVIATRDDVRTDIATGQSTATPVVQSLLDSAGDVLSAQDRRRDHAVRELLMTQLNTTPVCTPEFDAPYPVRSGTYSYLNNYNDDYRPQRHASNCSPNRWAIFPYAVHVAGVSVTSSSPTYVVGGNCGQRYYTPMPQQNCSYAQRTPTYPPTYSRPPQNSTPGTPTTITTTVMTPSTPSNTPSQPNRPPATTTTTSFNQPLHGNNGVGNGVDPQPPGNPRPNDGYGTGPGHPGNQRARR